MSNEAPNVMVNCSLFWPNLTHKNELAGKYTVDVGNIRRCDYGVGRHGTGIHNKGDERETTSPVSLRTSTVRSDLTDQSCLSRDAHHGTRR